MVACSLPKTSEEKAAVKTAEEFAADFRNADSRRASPIRPCVSEITPHLSAKIAASATRIRIRENAEFSLMELEALWNARSRIALPYRPKSAWLTNSFRFSPVADLAPHSHPRRHCGFLTRSLVTRCRRMRDLSASATASRPCNHVEKGADFIELYRWFLLRSEAPPEAFYDTSADLPRSDSRREIPFYEGRGVFGRAA
jgi:hypothetical protein